MFYVHSGLSTDATRRSAVASAFGRIRVGFDRQKTNATAKATLFDSCVLVLVP